MENKYFELNENFEEIINKILNNKIINNMEQITTGWTNIVYEVETNDGNYFFRFPRDEFWSRTIVKDCEFAEYIHNKTEFNTSNLELHYDNGRPFSVHKKIPGIPLAVKMDELKQDEVKDVSDDIAKFMYELHTIEYDRDEVFKTKDISLELKGFLTELLNLHVSNEDKKFWNENENDIEAENLVHGDLNPSNVLLDNNNKVTAIIDFGFGGFGNKYDDISRIIGRCPEKFKEPIVDSYEKYANNKLDLDELNRNISQWNNIDSGYINYMREIGIYKD